MEGGNSNFDENRENLTIQNNFQLLRMLTDNQSQPVSPKVPNNFILCNSNFKCNNCNNNNKQQKEIQRQQQLERS